MRQVCSNCKWSKQDIPFGDFTCHNTESDYYACDCMDDDYCDEWEGYEDE